MISHPQPLKTEMKSQKAGKRKGLPMLAQSLVLSVLRTCDSEHLKASESYCCLELPWV